MTQDALSCLYTNANSLKNKKHEFLNRIDKTKPDIIGVTEVWQKDDISVPGYQVAADKIRPGGVRGGGVLLLMKDHLRVKECDVLNSLKFEESAWCIVNTSPACRLLVGICYRSPSSTFENNQELLRLMDALKTTRATD